MPKVTIITPCYNARDYIERTIQSVRAQTCGDWEYVIVDDGSSDHTREIVAAYADADPRIRLIRQPNGGVCQARNVGYRAASCESHYLLFLDQDDCLHPSMLEQMAGYLDSHPDAGLAHCGFDLIDEHDQPARDSRNFERYVVRGKMLAALSPEVARTPPEAILWWCSMLPSACLIRRHVYERTPGWDESF